MVLLAMGAAMACPNPQEPGGWARHTELTKARMAQAHENGLDPGLMVANVIGEFVVAARHPGRFGADLVLEPVGDVWLDELGCPTHVLESLEVDSNMTHPPEVGDTIIVVGHAKTDGRLVATPAKILVKDERGHARTAGGDLMVSVGLRSWGGFPSTRTVWASDGQVEANVPTDASEAASWEELSADIRRLASEVESHPARQ